MKDICQQLPNWAHSVVWLGLFLWHSYLAAHKFNLWPVKSTFTKGMSMTLTKAFDPSALIAALKAKGIQDAELLVNDEMPVIFDWLNTSVGMVVPAPYNVIATGVLADLEAKATAEIQALEKTIS